MKFTPLLLIILFGVRLGAVAEMRTWTLNDGRTFEAEIAAGLPGINTVKMITGDGRKVEVPLDQLSAEDRKYIELSHPPKLEIDILKSLKTMLYSARLTKWGADVRPSDTRATFGVRVKQVGTGDYPYELKAELFAIGRQIYADRYILLDRETWTFRLTNENKRRFEEMGQNTITLQDFVMNDYYDQQGFTSRGEKYHGYIIVVTDERGEIVAHNESSNWLWDNFDNLTKLRKGNYLDQTCARRYPIRPETMRLISSDFQ